MSQLYARVFVKILQSSLADDWHARHVFEDCLKLASRDGIVDVTRSAFCRITNAPPDIVDRAFAVLEAPDPSSRDATEQGRRLVRLDEHRNWGWRIVNWDKYEAIRTKNDEREVERNRKRESRDRVHPPTPPPATPDTATSPASASGHPGHVPDMSRTCPGQSPIPADLLPVEPAGGPKPRRREAAASILAGLNELAGRSFEAVPVNINPIVARLAEVQDDTDGVLAMVRRQVDLWKTDEKMAPYLRPATLFNRTKFRAYYDDRNQPIPAAGGPRGPVNGHHHRNHWIGTPESRAAWQLQADERIAKVMGQGTPVSH